MLQASVEGAARRWRTSPRTPIEAALREALVDGLGLKPKVAFAPLRVAVTGRRVSPPLFESMELLGRERDAAPGCARPGSPFGPGKPVTSRESILVTAPRVR